MTRYDPVAVRALVGEIGVSAGLPAGDAALFADALIDADLHGRSTHGLSRLAIYMKRMDHGLIDPRAELRVERHAPGVLSVDARNGVGQVQAIRTLERLRPLAVDLGVAAATIRGSQHFGALGYYCDWAAERDMILLATTAAEPAMSPTGGYEPFFGTNPIGAGFPTGKGWPVTIDLATSIVARGNIIAAEKEGRPIPEGWALDADGHPTTDAAAALAGTVLTMAGHKGYALALLVELLSSVLSGAAVGPSIGSMYKDLDRPQDVGHFFCLLRISAFMDPEAFRSRVDATIDRITSLQPRPGSDGIRVPGEHSARKARENRRLGIALGAATVREVDALADRYGISTRLEQLRVPAASSGGPNA
ncbi:MAG: Ldh family oxidoreductase [Longimicrobiales bacterium]|nr:Ldh family oxidoreductase [Longimicrobiales bacterium]